MSRLGQVYLFADLDEAEKAKVEGIAQASALEAGQEVFREGDSADALYIVKYGSVRLSQSGDNATMMVTQLGSGSHMGEMGLIDGGTRSATATVLEHSEIVAIPYADLESLFAAEPVIAVKVYRACAIFLSGRLRQTTRSLNFARDSLMHG